VNRIKGNGGQGTELSVYLKTGNTEQKIPGGTVLRAGNTIQLSYLVNTNPPPLSGNPAAGNPAAALIPREKYGVIFSIDGRSAVTLHFPYTPNQSTRLVTGKPVPLAEAYTLDDAPDCEIFFIVIDDEPLDTREVLRAAERLAGNPATAEARGESLLWPREVKIITMRKE
jgi:hypothetical protein